MAINSPNPSPETPRPIGIPPNPYDESIPANPYEEAGKVTSQGREALERVEVQTERLRFPRDFNYWRAAGILGIPTTGQYREKVREELQAAFEVAATDFRANSSEEQPPPSAFNIELYLRPEIKAVLANRHGVDKTASYTVIRQAQNDHGPHISKDSQTIYS